MKLSKLDKRLLSYSAILLVFLGIYGLRTRWSPGFVHETTHYKIRSTAPKDITSKLGNYLEVLYAAYREEMKTPKDTQPEKKFVHQVYQSHKEFKRVNPRTLWAEAFYRRPTCHEYLNNDDTNPYHWAIHEATHQLNDLLSEYKIPKWAEEGVACVFGCSVIRDGKLIFGEIELDSYPVWYLRGYPLSGDIEKDKSENLFFPLDDILHDREPVDMDENVNDYYVHWLVTTHYFFFGENGKHRANFLKYLRKDCPIDDFEKTFGSIKIVEKEIYEHFQGLTNIQKPVAPSELK